MPTKMLPNGELSLDVMAQVFPNASPQLRQILLAHRFLRDSAFKIGARIPAQEFYLTSLLDPWFTRTTDPQYQGRQVLTCKCPEIGQLQFISRRLGKLVTSYRPMKSDAGVFFIVPDIDFASDLSQVMAMVPVPDWGA